MDADAHAVDTSSEMDRPDARILAFSEADILRIDQFVIHRGNGVLPDEFFLRNFRAEITRARTHIAVRQLEPRSGERIGELIRMLHEASRNFFVGRVEPQREVGGQHGRPVFFRRIVRIRHRGVGSLRHPLVRAARALRQFPFVIEKVLEKVVAPLGRGVCPGNFQAAGDGVRAFACAEVVFPPEAHLFETRCFGLVLHVRGRRSAVSLAKAMATGDERDGFLVVHGHAAEGVANIVGRLDGIRIAIRTFGVDVNQAHLYRGQWILQFA